MVTQLTAHWCRLAAHCGGRMAALLPARRVEVILGPVALALALLLLYLQGSGGVLDRQERVRGRDFLAFYVHGRVLSEGGGPLLYDAEHFRATQTAVASITAERPRYFPIYPPATALLFAPLATLPYETALLVWWLVLGSCFVTVAYWLTRLVQPAPDWRRAFVILLAAYYPVFSTFLNGQFSGVLLLIALTGLELHYRRQPFWAGLVLSLLTMKPQLAVGPALWLLLRRDVPALTGFGLGFLIQTGLVAACVGPDVLFAYPEGMKTYLVLGRLESNTPDHQHALAGILRDQLGPAWADGTKLLHGVFALAAAGLLWRVTRNAGTRDAGRYEHVAVLVYTLLATPHLLTYDLVLLLPAFAWLVAPLNGQRPTARVALAGVLYLAGTAPPLYHFTGVSMVPLVLLGALVVLAGLGGEDARQVASG